MFPMKKDSFFTLFALCFALLTASAQAVPQAQRPEVLFLGGSEVQESLPGYRVLKQVLGPRGINLTFAGNMGYLTPESLARYDVLIVQGIRREDPLPESILPWVRAGGGLVGLHGASESFPSSTEWVALIGGQQAGFEEHTFSPETVDATHPVSRNLPPLVVPERTVRHRSLAADRRVLQVRPPLNEGETGPEPWTWLREEDRGRVFYTGSGHDPRTWEEPSFQILIHRGIVWAMGEDRAEAFRAIELPDLVHNAPDIEDRTFPHIPMMPLQDPLSPGESAAHTQVAAGSRLQLFASEPMIVNPISIDWDERGRAWVVENLGYPNDVPEAPGSGADTIKILEDTTGDGRADKVTVFAEGLRHCTTTVFYNGGVIATDGKDIVFLKDGNGDGRADTRLVLATGLRIWDTHASTSNFHYGLDNWIYATVGYSGVEITLGETKHEFGASVFRFRPDLSALQQLQRTTNNTWGLGFTEEGDVMGSTANNNPSWILSIPAPLYMDTGIEQPHTPRADTATIIYPNTLNITQVDQINRYTAAAGHAFYTDNLLGDVFQPNHVFVADPTAHLVGLGEVVDNGSLKSTHFAGNNLFASSDAWSAPVAVRTGPDGAIWIADWYNPIIQHNVVFRFWNPKFGYDQAHSPYHTGANAPGAGNAYRTPLRDRDHGRIWRIVPAGGAAREPIELDPERPHTLLAALRSPSQHTRLHAQRLLIQRKEQDVALELVKLIAEKTPAAGGTKPLTAIHAIWTLEGLGLLAHPGTAAHAVVTQALAAEADPLIRRHALQALSADDSAIIEALPLLLTAITEPRERLFALKTAAATTSHPPISQALWNLATGSPDLDDVQREAISLAMHRQSSTLLTTVLANGGPALPDGWQTEVLFEVATRVSSGPGRPALLSVLGAAPAEFRPRLESILAATESLEVAEKQLPSHLEAGFKAYRTSCVECHQGDGGGVPGTFPPLLADSPRVGGSRHTILRVVIGGLYGPVEVGGQTYDNVMPGFGYASDDEIAATVSYVRYAFANKKEEPISTEEIQTIRNEMEKRRSIPWTAAEIEKAEQDSSRGSAP